MCTIAHAAAIELFQMFSAALPHINHSYHSHNVETAKMQLCKRHQYNKATPHHQPRAPHHFRALTKPIGRTWHEPPRHSSSGPFASCLSGALYACRACGDSDTTAPRICSITYAFASCHDAVASMTAWMAHLDCNADANYTIAYGLSDLTTPLPHNSWYALCAASPRPRILPRTMGLCCP